MIVKGIQAEHNKNKLRLIAICTLTISAVIFEAEAAQDASSSSVRKRHAMDFESTRFDGLIITPKDYMRRRRPTVLDSKVPVAHSPAPAKFHCDPKIPAPTKVSISVHIAEISLVSNGEVTLSMYLRYSWEDFRLTHIKRNALGGYVEIASTVKNMLWLPDLYIPNAATVINPVIFVPSTSFRIYENHTIFANQYLVLELSCPFNYALFPMDVQICDIALQSFGSSPCETNMTWAEHLPLTYSTSTLSQFSYHLHRSNDGAEKGVFHTSSKSVYERSQIHMYVVLTRKIMFYMMQIYIPSMLFVVVSWISFLIPAEMAQGRMLLTITTMLTMVSLFAAGSEYVPKASYVKAIDVWMCLCTFLSFFAVVDCLADVRLESMLSGESRRKATDTFVLTGQARRQTVVEIFMKYARAGGAPAQGEDPGERDEQIASANTLTEMLVKWFFKAHRASVIVYPVVFILFNIVYWVVCLGTLEELDLGARGVPV